MAFVYKDARRFSQKPPTKRKVGPGTYFGHSEYTIKKSIVPFQSSSFREGLKGGDQPGPGTYNVSNEYLKDKLIATNLNMDIKIVEVPKPNYVFKSGAKRFEDVHLKKKMENEPGPGHYHSSHDISKISFKYIKQNNPERMLFDELKKEKKIGQVPSIPTAQRLLGYSENEDKILELNKNFLIRHSGVKDDQVGPGEYNIKEDGKKRNKGTDWHKSKSVKLKKIEEENRFLNGPGSYDPIVCIKPSYQDKQQLSSFLSKSNRLFDIRKGAITNQNLLEKLEEQTKYSQHSTNVSSKNWQNSIEDEIEYIDESTPGPGYYYNEKLSSSFNSHKIVKRFKQKTSLNRFADPNPGNPEIGPGKYEIAKNLLKKKQIKQKNEAPFSISDLRFKEPNTLEVPGPGTYEHPKALQNDLLKKAKIGYKGNFSTKEKRFISEELTNEIPGPGEYIALSHYGHKNELTQGFKSSTGRQIFAAKNDISPDMNTYNVHNFDLALSAQKGVESDPELAKKIPQFNRSEPRFIELRKLEKEEALKEFNSDSILIHQKTFESLLQPKNNNLAPFNTGAQRFIYSTKEERPGPGTYEDHLKIDWSKRSYNVDFAEK